MDTKYFTTCATRVDASSSNNPGPQAALDVIISDLFAGQPNNCRILEARTRLPKGIKRNRDRSRYVRIPYPDKFTQQHKLGIVHIVHKVLDVIHPPLRSAKSKHAHTNF